jgi:hypothetical protein
VEAIMKKIVVFGLLASSVLLGGCATSIAYRADYVPDRPVADNEQIAGRVLVYTTTADDERLVTAGATSFTGGGASLTTPIGMITREIAVKVFSRMSTEGAVSGNTLADSARFSVVVRPQSQDFRYGFPQLKNLGFAITPEIELSLRVAVLDPSGKTQFERDYKSGVVEGKSYMMSGSPYERINRLTHATMYDLMRKAADDVRLQQAANSSAAAPK